MNSLPVILPGTLNDESDHFELLDTQHGLHTLHRARSEQIEFNAKLVIVFKDEMVPSSIERPLQQIIIPFLLSEQSSDLLTPHHVKSVGFSNMEKLLPTPNYARQVSQIEQNHTWVS